MVSGLKSCRFVLLELSYMQVDQVQSRCLHVRYWPELIGQPWHGVVDFMCCVCFRDSVMDKVLHPCERPFHTSASVRVPQYKLRKTESVQLPLCSSSKHLLSFIPATAILWNDLPSRIPSLSSLKSFRHSLQVPAFSSRPLFFRSLVDATSISFNC